MGAGAGVETAARRSMLDVVPRHLGTWDYGTAVALAVAPRGGALAIAADLAARLQESALVDDVAAAPPGFLNLRLSALAIGGVFDDIARWRVSLPPAPATRLRTRAETLASIVRREHPAAPGSPWHEPFVEEASLRRAVRDVIVAIETVPRMVRVAVLAEASVGLRGFADTISTKAHAIYDRSRLSRGTAAQAAGAVRLFAAAADAVEVCLVVEEYSSRGEDSGGRASNLQT